MDKRWNWFFFILVLLIFSAFFTKDLWPVDETRYAEVGREVLSQKSVFLLTKNGEPYSHKPPLYPWLMALGYAVFGVRDWIPKLIPMLFSFGCLFAGGLVYRDLYNEKVPALFKVVLFSSLYYFIFSFYVMFDVLLTFWVLLAAHFYLNEKYPWFWAMLGLGILTKGPVVLVIIALPVLVHRVLKQGVTGLKPNLQFWLGVLIMLAIVAVWLVPLLFSAKSSFVQELLVKQNFGRMASAGSWAHQRPVYWYLFLFPVLAGPWALFWYVNGLNRDFWWEPGDRFIYVVVLTNLVAFSLISGKQMHYLIPVIPFLGFWIARHWEEIFATKATRLVIKGYGLTNLLLGLFFVWFGGGVHGFWSLSASLMESLKDIPPLADPSSLVSLAWIPVGILFILSGLVGLFKRMTASGRVTWVVAGAVVFLAWLSLILVPSANTIMSPKDISEQIKNYAAQGMQVAVYARGAYDAELNFYSQIDSFLVLKTQEGVGEFLAQPRRLLATYDLRILPSTNNWRIIGEGWSFGEKIYLIASSEKGR